MNGPTSGPAAGRVDWDDLRFFLAVARAGSLSAAARALRVDHSTVSRRIRALERRAGARLFERRADGYAPTSAGAELREAALRVEEEIQAAERRLAGRDEKLEGPLRAAMSDVAVRTLLPDLRTFTERHPAVALELVVGNHLSDLARGEADVALRATEAPPADSLVGRRLSRVASSLYASNAYLERRADTADLAAHDWIGLGGELARSLSGRWMRREVPGARIVAALDSMLLAHAAVREGLGIAFLPCVIGDADPDLRRVRPDFLLPGYELWALTHRDLRATARVRAFLDCLRDAIARMRERIEGRRPQPPLAALARAGRRV